MINKIEIQKTCYGGYGIAEYEGRELRIPFSVAGDIADIEITHDKGTYLEGTIKKLITPSKDRVRPHCKYYEKCGGCQWGHISLEKQREFKADFIKEALIACKKYTGQAIECHNSDSLGYRVRAVIRAKDGKVGFYKARSNDFIPVEKCPIMSETLYAAVAEWASVWAHNGVSSLSVIETPNGEILAQVDNKSKLPKVRSAHPFTGLKIGNKPLKISDKGGLLGEGIYGNGVVGYNTFSGDIPVTFTSFFQANKHLMNSFQEYAINAAESLDTLELYAGAGFFTAGLQKKAMVKAIEISPLAATLAQLKNYPVEASDAAKIIEINDYYGQIFVDPPREGMEKIVTNHIAKLNPESIIYVSCNPTTLARDLSLLPNYSVVSAAVFDMFPHTYHVETIVKLRRRT